MGEPNEPMNVPPAPEKRKRGRPKKVRPPNPFDPGNDTGKSMDFTVPPNSFVCETCGIAKPSTQFTRFLELVAEAKAADEDWSIDRLCDHCATYGPPLENPLAKLSPKEIEALSVLAAGGSMRRAALCLGVDERSMRNYLAGREKPVIRAAYQKLCIQMGLTPEALARVVVEALGATKSHFNTDGELIGESPDHNVRLKAAAMGLKILQLEQPAELARRAADEDAMLRPQIVTNLDGNSTIDEQGYTVPYLPAGEPKRIN